jgi:glycosyltransferase involved in cell wall biosynthesis
MKVLIASDSGVSTGYGRIADEIGIRLKRRGYDVMALSYYYDALLPAQMGGTPLPYHVGSLAGKPNPVAEIGKVVNVWQPDVVLGIQDAPYHINLFQSPVCDWSRFARVYITPVDGVPMYPDWVQLAKQVDGVLTISEFGVKAFAEVGVKAALCRPGVNTDDFTRKTDAERAALREKLGIKPGAFLLGTMCQNQGRKAVTLMLKGFMEFAKDKPDARYLMDMDEASMAGWHIPNVIAQQGWDASKVIYRSDAIRAGVTSLSERYNVLDAHAVLAHREGYGLPLAEAMACGVVSMAMDYCSGTEIVGDGRGCLIRDIGYTVPGTWGGAEDRFPDLTHFVEQLNWLNDNPAEREAMALRGMAWARAQTWDAAADAVQRVIDAAAGKRAAWMAAQPVAPEVQAVAA